jgi:cell division protein FtsB
MDNGSIWVLIPLAAIAASMIVRLKHGWNPYSRRNSRKQSNGSTDEVVQLRQENADLKAQISRMEERMQTLEKIVTDPAERLSREIERLN